MEKQIDKLEGLLDKENFQSSTEDISVDDQIPYVFCNTLMALSERLGEIETKLGITD